MVDDYMLRKVLDKIGIKEIIGIEKVDDIKIGIKTADKLLQDFTFINVMILITCVIKDLFLQLFFEEALL